MRAVAVFCLFLPLGVLVADAVRAQPSRVPPVDAGTPVQPHAGAAAPSAGAGADAGAGAGAGADAGAGAGTSTGAGAAMMAPEAAARPPSVGATDSAGPVGPIGASASGAGPEPLSPSASPAAPAAPAARIEPQLSAADGAGSEATDAAGSGDIGGALEAASAYGAVAVAPSPFGRLPLDKVPNNVQKLDGRALRGQHALGLHDALNAQLGSVTINDVQSNPLQPDLQFRGFTASPLLGTPQGISVYQNGVRLNEPFGDLVQWDLIPLFALWEVQVMPGGNPVYGLNTLGGSLVMRMNNGWTSPGARIEASAGSFSRFRVTTEVGRDGEDWAAYAGGSLFGEQGFRDKSQSSAQTLYADTRKRGADYELGVGLTLAHTDLTGNGPTPYELLAKERSAIYTWPDNTQNLLALLSVDGQKRLSRRSALQGTLYLRHTTRATSNGDAAEISPCLSRAGVSALCTDGDVLTSETGALVPADRMWNAVFNTTQTASNGFGGSLQLDVKTPLAERPNRLLLGASYDGSQVTFAQRSALGELTTDRGVLGGGPSLAGPGRQTDLFAANHLFGLYAFDTLDISDGLSLQASARLNWYSTALADRRGDALSGHHVFARVNPALGLTQKLGDAVTLFAGYGESNRAPSAAELACADPDEPCRLPNAFISDPPLKQVVSRSAELGLRWRVGAGRHPLLHGSVAAFGARNHDDILFVAGSRVGTGYFRNAGQTQRLGAELALRAELGSLQLYASYTLLRATFESQLRLPRNEVPGDGDGDGAEAADQVQRVAPGARIPGLPMHSVKAGVSYHVLSDLELGVSLLGQSSQPMRGDEANLSPFVRGYMIVNAQASYHMLPELTLFVRAQNLFDQRFETFGVLANPAEVLPGATDPRFLGPGAPFGIWAGIVFEEPS